MSESINQLLLMITDYKQTSEQAHALVFYILQFSIRVTLTMAIITFLHSRAYEYFLFID